MGKNAMVLPFSEILRLVRAGDKVKFLAYAGLGRNGPEYKERVGSVNPLLIFANHMTVNCGGRYGTPAVVDEKNFVAVMLPRGESFESRKAAGENLMRRFL